MIIRTNVTLPKVSSASKVEETAVNEEVIVKPVVRGKRKKSTSIIIEEPIMIEEKVEVEDEDLSKWLEEHIED